MSMTAAEWPDDLTNAVLCWPASRCPERVMADAEAVIPADAELDGVVISIAEIDPNNVLTDTPWFVENGWARPALSPLHAAHGWVLFRSELWGRTVSGAAIYEPAGGTDEEVCEHGIAATQEPACPFCPSVCTICGKQPARAGSDICAVCNDAMNTAAVKTHEPDPVAEGGGDISADWYEAMKHPERETKGD